MASLSIEEIKEILDNVEGVSKENCAAILGAVQVALEEKKHAPKEKKEKAHKDWMIVSDDLCENLFIVQLTENEDGVFPSSVQSAIDSAVSVYSNSVKKKKPTSSITEIFENVGKKYFKACGLLVKTSSPVALESCNV